MSETWTRKYEPLNRSNSLRSLPRTSGYVRFHFIRIKCVITLLYLIYNAIITVSRSESRGTVITMIPLLRILTSRTGVALLKRRTGDTRRRFSNVHVSGVYYLRAFRLKKPQTMQHLVKPVLTKRENRRWFRVSSPPIGRDEIMDFFL